MLEIHMKLCMAEPEPDILWGVLPNKLKKWTQNDPQTVFFSLSLLEYFF